MAQFGKKPENLNILTKIYHGGEFGEKSSRKNKIKSIKKYFDDPKNVEIWLSGAVLFFGFLGIIFGFFHFKNQIKSPYFRPVDSQQSNLMMTAEQDLLGLSQKDTDQDGLSDYDELYIYNTSPYLEDSDSDGLDDQKEISRGSDPNCPAGQNCFAFQEVSQPAGEQEMPLQSPGSPFSSLLSGQVDVNQLRELLKQAGMSEEMLNNLSDQDLLAAYQEVLLGGGLGETSQAAKTVSLPVQQIQDLTPEQIRQLLKESGVSEDTLNQISDEELMKLVQETLQEIQ